VQHVRMDARVQGDDDHLRCHPGNSAEDLFEREGVCSRAPTRDQRGRSTAPKARSDARCAAVMPVRSVMSMRS